MAVRRTPHPHAALRTPMESTIPTPAIRPLKIATVIVFVYYGASGLLPDLAKRPLLWGPLYGIAVYLFMNGVVIPLSAATGGMPKLPVLINGIAIHILGVGIPSALTTR